MNSVWGLAAADDVTRLSIPARVARVLVCAVFLLPFLWLTHPWPLHSFYNEWIAGFLMLLVVGAGIFMSTRERQDAFRLPLASLLFAGLGGVVAVQYALGMFTYSSNALFPVLILSLAAAACASGAHMARRIGLSVLVPSICLVLIAGGLFNVLVQLIQLMSNSGIDLPFVRFRTSGSLYGALGQQNHLATYLCWALVSTLYLYARRSLRPGLAVLVITLLLAGLTMTTSRMTWVQVTCIAVAGSLFILRMDAPARPARWYLLIALPLWYLAVSLLLPQLLEAAGIDGLRSSLARIATEEIGGPRRRLMEQAWSIFLAHPVLGVGPGEFNYHQFMLPGRMEGVQFASSPHNILFDLLAMTGLVGTLLFLAILVPLLFRIVSSARTIEAVACVLMLAAFGIHTLLEYPQWYAYFLLPAAFLFGALETKFIRIPQNLLSRTLPAASVAYGIALSAMLLVQYAQLEALYARHYVRNRLVTTVDSKAVERIDGFAQQTLFTGPAEYLLCFNFYLNEIALERKLAISSRAVRYLAEPNIVYRHVILLALSGRQEEGIAFLRQMAKHSPKEYDEVARELRRLGDAQPEIFGLIGAWLAPEKVRS